MHISHNSDTQIVSPGLLAILDAAQQQPPVAEVALHAVRVSRLPGSEGFTVSVRAEVTQPHRGVVSGRGRRHEEDLSSEINTFNSIPTLPAKYIDCAEGDDLALALETSCEQLDSIIRVDSLIRLVANCARPNLRPLLCPSIPALGLSRPLRVSDSTERVREWLWLSQSQSTPHPSCTGYSLKRRIKYNPQCHCIIMRSSINVKGSCRCLKSKLISI